MNLFKTIWVNKKQIIEGLKNNTFKKDDIEALSEYRVNICKTCPHYDTVGTGCLIPGTQPCCSNCGCSLKLKTRSLSSKCPLDKWSAVLSEDEVSDNIDAIDKIVYDSDDTNNS